VEGVNVRSALVAVASAVAFFSLHSNATTCVAGKNFKVPQVCGTVRDKYGAVISDTEIQITPKGHPEAAKSVISDQDGRFDFQNVGEGEYELRAKHSAFWDGWQPFRVSSSAGNRKRKKPIRIVMVPAGGCSYVENAWKKSDLKK
jgi:hypothetical protein